MTYSYESKLEQLAVQHKASTIQKDAEIKKLKNEVINSIQKATALASENDSSIATIHKLRNEVKQ